MGLLVAVGYILGRGGYRQFLPSSGSHAQLKHTAIRHHRPKPRPIITIKDAPGPKPAQGSANPSILDLLKYGEMEDASVDETPDISWYEPGQHDAARTSDTNQSAAGKTLMTRADQIHPSAGKRPKLAIIIDDVSHKRQLDTIKSLPYHITPSIFPPSELSSTSNKLADHLKHFMVHLPMESGSVAMNRMRGMLFVHDSAAKVQKRVDDIRRLFPRAKFVNNHTGSVFTSNYKAMKRLYGMMRKKGFVFIDSRTTGKSKVRRIAREFGDTYIARDVFLDNVQDETLILKQLKKAVHIARKRGFAIAIGHPHPATMRALKHAAKILSGVQTVYIDELYRQ
jgi:polysaccharide deacetylase 2 family uncharacterized protein YibQ